MFLNVLGINGQNQEPCWGLLKCLGEWRKWQISFGNIWQVLIIFYILLNLLYNPEISFLDIYSGEMNT